MAWRLLMDNEAIAYTQRAARGRVRVADRRGPTYRRHDDADAVVTNHHFFWVGIWGRNPRVRGNGIPIARAVE